MLYYTFLSVSALVFCLSLSLVYRVSVLESDFRALRRDIIHQLNQPPSEELMSDGRAAKMSKARREDARPSAFQQIQKGSLESSLRRDKREPGGARAPQSFLQLSANTNKHPYVRGNVTVIPWSVAVQNGQAISLKENKIVVQEDGYYMVFGQVLFQGPGNIMGYVVRSWSSGESGARLTELLRCLQEMPQANGANSCYTAGIVKLQQQDGLELLVPTRPDDHTLICTHADATFFGVMLLD